MLIFPWVTPMALAVVILAGRKKLTVEAASSNNADDARPVSVSACLNKTGASLVYPRESIYANFSVSQNTNYHTHPEIIVIPSSTEEVAATVRCVAAEKGRTKISIRGGGHSYAAYSLSGQVVIDSSQMRSITFDDDRKQVTVKFGQSLGQLALAMGKGKYALPHGTCPTVGISGHSLGGGWGFTSRKWGWLVDRIVSVEFVDINGNIKILNPSSTGDDAELWWAVRGAGANNFGVVTSFTYLMETAPSEIINYGLNFATYTDCVRVLLALQEIGSIPADDPDGLPVEFGGELILNGDYANTESACMLTGQYLGNKSDYTTTINRLLEMLRERGVAALESGSYAREFSDWITALTDLMGPLDTSVATSQPYYAQSLLDDGDPDHTLETIEAVADALMASVDINGTHTHISFDLNGPGSATNRRPVSDGMSFEHWQSLFLVQIYSNGFPGFDNPNSRTSAVNRITNIADTIKQSKSKKSNWHAYQNYVDPYLQNFGMAYYGSALDRLKAVKRSADPDTIFDHPQGLGHA